MPALERVLVVDDEAPILLALRRAFESAGYAVTSCTDPLDALQLLRSEKFPVLCTDYMMPGISGAEFLARARETQPDTVRILITAATDFSAAAAASPNLHARFASPRQAEP